MEIQDLRVANILSDKDGCIFKVKGFKEHCGGVAVYGNDTWKYLKNLNPIPLSEEILLKCGFVARGTFWYDFHLDEKTKLTLGWHPDGRIDFEISINKIYFDISHIEYLHQIQNLYYILKGKELDINTTDLAF